jgi:predicted nucleic acid-binding Zn ribbon protein
MQKFSDEPLKIHQDCGGALQRLISPPAFQFKGSGWYITDYARKNGSSSSAGGAHTGENGKSKEPAKTEAKPSGDSAKPKSKSES